MANKRDIKKRINYIASELFTECVAQSLFIPETDKEKADKLMSDILCYQDDFLQRIGQIKNIKPLTPKKERNKKVRVFFKQLQADSNAKTDAFIEALGKLK